MRRACEPAGARGHSGARTCRAGHAGDGGALLPTFERPVAQWQSIADAGVSGDDFPAPLPWTFFAVMHPLLAPVLWISGAARLAWS